MTFFLQVFDGLMTTPTTMPITLKSNHPTALSKRATIVSLAEEGFHRREDDDFFWTFDPGQTSM